MARSAQELFEEAMRLDPNERATLMCLLIDTLDAEFEGGSEGAGRVEVERRIAELDAGQSKWFLGRSSEPGCTSAEWRHPSSGSTLPQRRRWNRPMTGMQQEMLFSSLMCDPSSRWAPDRQ
jgi:hypothetical protein